MLSSDYMSDYSPRWSLVEERNMTVWRWNCSSGIVHHIPAPVERHLGLVLGVEGRVIVVAGVVEVLLRPHAVLRVESLLLTVSGGFTTSLSRGDRGRDYKCKDQTDQHQTGDAVEQDLDVDQYFRETSICERCVELGLVHALCLLYAAALGNNTILFRCLTVRAGFHSINVAPVVEAFDPATLECRLEPVPEMIGQDVLRLVVSSNVPVEAGVDDAIHSPRPRLSVEEDESSNSGSEQDEENHYEAPQHAD